ncbi:MAG: Uncharacterised protein [Cryomorphaceae bacterium]|nr:MAG: Uncharacterised protein [Cryomorphaceae bacterium]|tara:strand:- start:499 stop:1056 length:558 start_codon:yes stop_codon:yes gene_type:complete
MIKFLGLLSKKKKVKAELAATIYVNLLNNVIEVGFVEIKDFINNNNNLEDNPNLTNLDIDWFKNIVFLGNIKNLNIFFEENDSSDLRGYILDEMYKELSKSDQHLAIERFLDYENYFDELLIENEDSIGAMAYGIFEKYNINEFQGDLFKRKNKPNPIFYNELKNLLTHFIWNWDDYLEKNKLSF